MSVAQAKANLLQCGEAATGPGGELGRHTLWLTVGAALAGAAVTSLIPRRRARQDHAHGGGRMGLLLTLWPLVRPLLPIVMQYLAKHRAARAQAGAAQGEPQPTTAEN